MNTGKYNLYIAAPLFSEAEKTFNVKLKQFLANYFEVFLPQEDGGLVAEMVQNGMNTNAAKEKVFEMDIQAMELCDILLIVLDERSIDEGAAFELGYAYARQKICVGFQTDSRRLLPQGNNPMLEGACTQVFCTWQDLLHVLLSI